MSPVHPSRRAVLRGVAGVAAAGALASCGSGDTDSLAIYLGSNASFPQHQRQWMDRIRTAFAKRTGASLTFQTYSSAGETQQQIQTAVISEVGPDVWHVGTTFVPTAWASSSFLTFGDSEWDAVGGRSRFTKATLAMSGPGGGGEQVGVPFMSRPYVMAYDTELLRRLRVERPPGTWDDLVELAKRATSGNRYGFAVGYQDGYDPWKYVWTLARQAGNPLVDGTTAELDRDTVVNAYAEFFGWLTRDHVVDPASVGWRAANAGAAFAQGHAAFQLMTTPAALPTLRSSAVAKRFALAPMPTVPPGASKLPDGGVPAASIVSGDDLVVAGYTKRRDLALAYIDLVTSTEEQLFYSQTFGELPTNDAAAREVARRNPVFGPVLTAGTRSYPTPFTGAWTGIQLGLGDIATQSLPSLANGRINTGDIHARLTSLQHATQKSLDRERNR